MTELPTNPASPGDPRLADLISPAKRRVVYAALKFLALAAAAVIVFIRGGLSIDELPELIYALGAAGGFQLAESNTPRT